MSNCILCGEHQRYRYLANPDIPNGRYSKYEANGIPEPIIDAYGMPGHFPGNRSPRLTDATYGKRPGTPSNGVRMFERSVTRTNDIGPTDYLNPFTRSVAAGGFIRWVNEQYVIPGGPAGAAQGLYGKIHNYGYMTIADTLKPAQQLPRYNLASVDTETMIDRARATLMRTLYGVG